MEKYTVDDLVVEKADTPKKRRRRKKKIQKKSPLGTIGVIVAILAALGLLYYWLADTPKNISNESGAGNVTALLPVSEEENPSHTDTVSPEQDRTELEGQLKSIEQDMQETLKKQGASQEPLTTSAATPPSEENLSITPPHDSQEKTPQQTEAPQNKAGQPSEETTRETNKTAVAAEETLPAGESLPSAAAPADVKPEKAAAEAAPEHPVDQGKEANDTATISEPESAAATQVPAEAVTPEQRAGSGETSGAEAQHTVPDTAQEPAKETEQPVASTQKESAPAAGSAERSTASREERSETNSAALQREQERTDEPLSRMSESSTADQPLPNDRKEEKVQDTSDKKKETQGTPDDRREKGTEGTSDKEKDRSAHRSKKEEGSFFDLFKRGPRYFIKVRKTPKSGSISDTISRIRKAGLHSVIEKGGKERSVLVGPYSSYKEAKAELAKVKIVTRAGVFIVKSK